MLDAMHSRSLFYGALVSLSLAAILAVPGPASATFEGRNGKIAFSRNGIVLARADGSGFRRLTSGQDFGPAFSPKGKEIAFVRGTEPEPDVFKVHIYVMRADGSNVHRVSRGIRGFGQPPVWSPDGRWIAYGDVIFSDEPQPGPDVDGAAIKIVHPDGSGHQRVTGYGAFNASPAWSPDSQRIAFVSDRDGDAEILVMDRKGSNKTQLTSNDVVDDIPEWSPDGSRIAFTRSIPGPPNQGDEGVAIWTMEPDGNDPLQLTDGSRFDQNPQWSPNGLAIGFTSSTCDAESCIGDLWSMDRTGGSLTNLTEGDDRFVDYQFAWSPNSTKIAFGLEGDVHTVDTDTLDRSTVSEKPAFEALGDWQAKPSLTIP